MAGLEPAVTPPARARDQRIVIGSMRVEDVPGVYRLGEQLFGVNQLPVLFRTWDPYEVAHLFASEIDLSLIARSGKRVVGFCLSTTIEKPGKPWRYGYLIWLGVARGAQRKLVGKRLLTTAIKRLRAQGVRYMLLDTESENTGAIAFFERLGFSPRSTQTWLWKNIGKRDASG